MRTGEIAPRLDAALKAAGVPIVGVSPLDPLDKSTWRIDYTPDATDAQKIAGALIVEAFDPLAPEVGPRLVSRLAFARLFTAAERIAIRAAAAQSGALADFYELLNFATEVHLDHADVAAGLAAMVGAGLLTAARRDQIQAGTPPV